MGQVLGGRYALEGEIGRGGMATVYRAHDRKHDCSVAVKILSPDLSPLLGSERFVREIRITAGLQHPNIVAVFDSGQEGHLLYYVMPLVEGETLGDRLRRETQLPLEDAVRIARDVAEALGHAHRHGVVHRDVKPENILLSANRALVSDFGIARAIGEAGGSSLTSAGIAVGTPFYMSPEQAGGAAEIDGRADLYALACVLYEMLGGEPPFTGPTPQSILARHMHEPPRSLRIVRPTVSLSLQHAVERGLAKVPADRFASADAFIEALGHIIPDRPVHRGLRIAAAASSVALLLVGTVFAWRTWGPGRLELDDNKVMVFPLIERGEPSPEGFAGETTALLIGHALEQTAPLRWEDGWTWLEPAVRADMTRLGATQARRLARDRGARWFVNGYVLRARDSVTVVLRLMDARGDSLVDQRGASGPRASADLPTLGLRAITQLLPALVEPGRRADLSVLETRRPAAVVQFLLGERGYRLAHYDSAVAHYQAALATDSLLTLAAVKGAQALRWMERDSEALGFLSLATGPGALLPPKYRWFAAGLRYYSLGDGDSAVSAFRAAIAADPTWAEGWAALGETYFHLLPAQGSLDSAASGAFERTVVLDPSFATPYFHLAEIYLRRGDLRTARRAIEGYRRLRPDSSLLRGIELAHDCVREGSTTEAWGEGARTDPEMVMRAAVLLGSQAAQPACAMEAARALLALGGEASLSHRWTAVYLLEVLLVAGGRTAEAERLRDSVMVNGVPQAEALSIVVAASGAGMDSAAARAMQKVAGRFDTLASFRLAWHYMWLSHVGDTAALGRLAAEFGRRGAGGGAVDVALRDAAAARVALARGDTTAALMLLTQLRAPVTLRDLQWGLWQSLPGERLLLAELLLRQGRAEEAWRVIGAFESAQPVLFVLYAPQSLALRARIADALGRPRVAADSRRRLRVLEREGQSIAA